MPWDGMPLDEDLVLSSLGRTSYLKLPSKFKRRFDLKGKELPNPRALYQVRESEGKVRLSYEWSVEDLENAETIETRDDADEEIEGMVVDE